MKNPSKEEIQKLFESGELIRKHQKMIEKIICIIRLIIL